MQKLTTQSERENSRKNILLLGWVSLLNDIGSEVLIRVIPLFVVGVLGAPMKAVGAIEGVAESTATLLKPLFGALSDRWGSRKPLVVAGYAFSALSRPFLAIAGSWPEVGFLRFTDRLGKGVRTAPRDALLADSSEGAAGYAFGLNRALDTLGALLGVGTFATWAWLHGERELTARTWVGLTLACSIPGILAVALTQLSVTEPKAETPAAKARLAGPPLPGEFRRYLVVVGFFALANSSDAFILLKAQSDGFDLAETLGIVALLNVVSSMTSLPAAWLSDRVGRRALIAAGWVIYAGCYAGIGTIAVGRPWVFAALVAVYGLFFGFTEGVEKAWIADLAPANARGKAYGFFGLVTGAVALPASLGFGWLWDRYGSDVPFVASAAVAMFAVALLFALMPLKKRV
jgi:MFS family permease